MYSCRLFTNLCGPLSFNPAGLLDLHMLTLPSTATRPPLGQRPWTFLEEGRGHFHLQKKGHFNLTSPQDTYTSRDLGSLHNRNRQKECEILK